MSDDGDCCYPVTGYSTPTMTDHTQQAQELQAIRDTVGDTEFSLRQQLAAMTRERDNYLSKWQASADLNEGLLRDYDASQARCREMEEKYVHQDLLLDEQDKLAQLQATLAARENELCTAKDQIPPDMEEDSLSVALIKLKDKLAALEPELEKRKLMQERSRNATLLQDQKQGPLQECV